MEGPRKKRERRLGDRDERGARWDDEDRRRNERRDHGNDGGRGRRWVEPDQYDDADRGGERGGAGRRWERRDEYRPRHYDHHQQHQQHHHHHRHQGDQRHQQHHHSHLRHQSQSQDTRRRGNRNRPRSNNQRELPPARTFSDDAALVLFTIVRSLCDSRTSADRDAEVVAVAASFLGEQRTLVNAKQEELVSFIVEFAARVPTAAGPLTKLIALMHHEEAHNRELTSALVRTLADRLVGCAADANGVRESKLLLRFCCGLATCRVVPAACITRLLHQLLEPVCQEAAASSSAGTAAAFLLATVVLALAVEPTWRADDQMWNLLRTAADALRSFAAAEHTRYLIAPVAADAADAGGMLESIAVIESNVAELCRAAGQVVDNDTPAARNLCATDWLGAAVLSKIVAGAPGDAATVVDDEVGTQNEQTKNDGTSPVVAEPATPTTPATATTDIRLSDALLSALGDSAAKAAAEALPATASSPAPTAGGDWIRPRLPLVGSPEFAEGTPAEALHALDEPARAWLRDRVEDTLSSFMPMCDHSGALRGSFATLAQQVMGIAPVIARQAVEYCLMEAIVHIVARPQWNSLSVGAGRVCVEMCRHAPDTFPGTLAYTIALVFQTLPVLDTAVSRNLARWFAFHLVNTDFAWPDDVWMEWASAAHLPTSNNMSTTKAVAAEVEEALPSDNEDDEADPAELVAYRHFLLCVLDFSQRAMSRGKLGSAIPSALRVIWDAQQADSESARENTDTAASTGDLCELLLDPSVSSSTSTTSVGDTVSSTVAADSSRKRGRSEAVSAAPLHVNDQVAGEEGPAQRSATSSNASCDTVSAASGIADEADVAATVHQTDGSAGAYELELGRALWRGIQSKHTVEQMAETIQDAAGAAAGVDTGVQDTRALARAILEQGSHSRTHMLTYFDRYGDLLVELCEDSPPAQASVLDIILAVWRRSRVHMDSAVREVLLRGIVPPTVLLPWLWRRSSPVPDQLAPTACLSPLASLKPLPDVLCALSIETVRFLETHKDQARPNVEVFVTDPRSLEVVQACAESLRERVIGLNHTVAELRASVRREAPEEDEQADHADRNTAEHDEETQQMLEDANAAAFAAHQAAVDFMGSFLKHCVQLQQEASTDVQYAAAVWSAAAARVIDRNLCNPTDPVIIRDDVLGMWHRCELPATSLAGVRRAWRIA